MQEPVFESLIQALNEMLKALPHEESVMSRRWNLERAIRELEDAKSKQAKGESDGSDLYRHAWIAVVCMDNARLLNNEG